MHFIVHPKCTNVRNLISPSKWVGMLWHTHLLVSLFFSKEPNLKGWQSSGSSLCHSKTWHIATKTGDYPGTFSSSNPSLLIPPCLRWATNGLTHAFLSVSQDMHLVANEYCLKAEAMGKPTYSTYGVWFKTSTQLALLHSNNWTRYS